MTSVMDLLAALGAASTHRENAFGHTARAFPAVPGAKAGLGGAAAVTEPSPDAASVSA